MFPWQDAPSCHLYTKLLRHNIELYEWKSSVLHGKTAVIDSNWTTIGSFNLNNLSSFGSIELNLGNPFRRILGKLSPTPRPNYGAMPKNNPESIEKIDGIFSKFNNWASYWIARIIEIVITYLPYNRFREIVLKDLRKGEQTAVINRFIPILRSKNSLNLW